MSFTKWMNRFRHTEEHMLRNHKRRPLRFEPLEGRMLLSANPSMWDITTYTSGVASSGSNYLALTADGNSQGGDNVVVAKLNASIVDDFYVVHAIDFPKDEHDTGKVNGDNGDVLGSLLHTLKWEITYDRHK